MAKNKFNKSWMHNHLNDPFVKQAQKEGYRARAVYKLSEIDEEFHLVRPNQIVVDLGCAPGSWSQYVARKFAQDKQKGMIIGLDLLSMEPIDGVHFIQGDFRENAVLSQLEALIGENKVNLVLSDMAPNLTGISDTDAARVEYLMELAIDFSVQHLAKDGALLVKCFNGPSYNTILKLFRDTFEKVVMKKPKASRDYSSEVYLLGQRLKK